MKGRKRGSHGFLGRINSDSKGLRQRNVWQVRRTARRPAQQEQSDQGMVGTKSKKRGTGREKW